MMPRDRQPSRSELARRMLARGAADDAIAAACGLHVAYVRKLRQRAAGTDAAWQRWRDENPERVRIYRRKQDRDRSEMRRQRRVAARQHPMAESDGIVK